MPFAAVILEIPDQFLLFRVHRDRRLLAAQARAHQAVDVTELGVAVGMPTAFAGFAVGLKAVAGFVQKRGNRPPADRVAHPRQFLGQPPGALAGPAQRRLRIATRRRFDQRLQRCKQLRIVLGQQVVAHRQAGGSASPRATAAKAGRSSSAKPGGDRRPRQPCGSRHRRDAALAKAPRFRGRPLSPHPFIHLRPQRLICAPNPFGYLCILHPQLNEPKPTVSRKVVQVIFGQALIVLVYCWLDRQKV